MITITTDPAAAYVPAVETLTDLIGVLAASGIPAGLTLHPHNLASLPPSARAGISRVVALGESPVVQALADSLVANGMGDPSRAIEAAKARMWPG